MNGDEMRAYARRTMDTRSKLRVAPQGEVAYARFYRTATGTPIAFEPSRPQGFLNLWVRAADVAGKCLDDLEQKPYDHRRFGESKPNHNLFREPNFRNVDLVCFKLTEPPEVDRVLAAVAGTP